MYYGSPDVPEEKINNIYKAYDLLEAVLKSSPYLVGDHLTLADLSCVATASSLCAILPAAEEKYPKLNAWIKRLAKLPYYAEINQKGVDILAKKYRETVVANQAAKK